MSGEDAVFLEHARLGARSDVLVRHDELAQMAGMRERFTAYALVDLAHAVMLVETGILDAQRGARLLGGLLSIFDDGRETFPWEPRAGSYLVQTEHYLAQRLGDDVAGRLQTGRSRNDQCAAADRIYVRDTLLEATQRLLTLEEALLERAREHADTLMPGYTHLQHAQAWTFGHFLMRHAAILERDLSRLEDAYPRTDLSALGGAANAGTSWPVDRERVRALLGHGALVVNASDAGCFARDYLEEVTAVLAIMAGNVGRLASDLYVFHSWEFGFLEVADGLAGTSSIMPQKKNPHALERIKAIGGQAAGWLASAMGCQRGVLSTDLDWYFGNDLFAPMRHGCVDALALAAESVATMQVHADAMAAKAGAFWGTASHLADELVRRHDLPFRTAHQVVGRLVRDTIAAGGGPADVEASRLAAAARAVGVEVEMDMDTAALREALDARAFLGSRISEGSVNPAHVRAHADALAQQVAAHHERHRARAATVERAQRRLLERARALAGAPCAEPRP